MPHLSSRLTLPVRFCLALLIAVNAAQSGHSQDRPLEIVFDFPELPSSPAGTLVRGSDGSLYGTHHSPTAAGGIFVLRPDGTGSYNYQLLHRFQRAAGSPPFGLTLGPDGHLYGATPFGGPNDAGTIFRITMDGQFTSLYSFSGLDGREPWGKLLAARDGFLYGTTLRGGLLGVGTIFRMTTSGSLTPLHWFTGFTGAFPASGLVQARDGHFYGTALRGGPQLPGAGTVFRMTAAGAVTRLHAFESLNESLGGWPAGTLIEASDGNLYGTTYRGGAGNSFGTVFKITTAGAFTQLHSFSEPGQGVHPVVSLTEGSDGLLYGVASGGLVVDQFLPSGLFRMTNGGSLEWLTGFTYKTGELPSGELLQAPDGAFYGTTSMGGNGGCGTVFRVTQAAGLQTLHHAPCVIEDPHALTLGRDGHFYGVTRNAGSPAYRVGSVFRLGIDGTYTPLHVLDKSHGVDMSALVQGPDGNFYGTTRTNGTSGSGTVFRITPDGAFSHVAFFGPFEGIAGRPLIVADDGSFYGTTEIARDGWSNVFRVTTSGELTFVMGPEPIFASGLIQGRDGFFYGSGGPSPTSHGIVFRMTSDGGRTTLHTFSGIDGSEPIANLLQASDGYLYGVTASGGSAGKGTIFRVSTTGAFTSLHSFTGGADGGRPQAALIEATDGQLYGTSVMAGFETPAGCVFRLDRNRLFSVVHTFPADFSEGTPALSGVLQGPDGALYGTTRNGRDRALRGLVYRIPLDSSSSAR